MYELDTFEKHYIKGEGEVIFRDKVPIPKYFLPMLLMGALTFSIATITMLGPLKGGLIALLGFLFVMIGNLAQAGYRLIVSEAGLQAYVGVRSRTIPFERIERMEVVEAGLSSYPLGKGIIRRGMGGVGYMPGLGPFRGVRIHIKNQKSHYFFASNQPEQLLRALQEGMARAQGVDAQQQVVLDLDTDAREVEQEVEHAATTSSARRKP